MLKKSDGFSMIELIMAMSLFVLVIMAASGVFTTFLTQFKQQSKIAEGQIEGIIGLEILRRDISHAGYGLPWLLVSGGFTATYLEAVNELKTSWDDTDFNDGPPNNPTRGTDIALNSNPPGGIRGEDGDGATPFAGTLNNSDVFVIKAANIARSEASQKWTNLFPGNTTTKWDSAIDRLETDDRVIVVTPLQNSRKLRLVASGLTGFTTRYDANADPVDDALWDGNFAPPVIEEPSIVYGITPPANNVADALRMPFNRADYYVRTPATNFPGRCAPGTGILYKAVISHANGLKPNELPLLDCVADMQVVYRLNTGGFASASWTKTLTAQQIRTQIDEVMIYILAHEGQRDPDFTFTNLGPTVYPGACDTCVRVGDSAVGFFHDFNFTSDFDTASPNWANYRWKLYRLAVTPNNI